LCLSRDSDCCWQIDIGDIAGNADEMIVKATFNVLSNNFEALVDIFLLYGHEHQVSRVATRDSRHSCMQGARNP